MCGIAGYTCFNEYDPRISTAMTLLGLSMQERGRRSWGWTDGNQVVKAVGTFEDSWNGSFQGYAQAALHTRQPTTGAVTEKNSHPFKIGDIIGMHNGIVHNHEELNKKYNRACDVDSEHIFHHINDGLELEDIRAYGAIVYWKDGKIHLGRFNNGDLTLVRTEVGFIFASTRSSLDRALRMSGLSKKNIFYKLKEDRLYRLNGTQLEKAGKLNFGSYSKSYGTWDGKTAGSPNSHTPTTVSSYGTRYPGTPGTGWGGYYGQGEWSDTFDSTGKKNGRQWQPTKSSKSVPRLPGTQTQQNLLPAHYKDSAAGRFRSTDDKIAALVIEAAKMVAGDSVKRPEEPAAKCKYCGEVITDGDAYTLSHTNEMMCEECSVRYVEESATCWLNELPVEILKVATLFDGNDKMANHEMVMDCDGCPEKLEGDEEFFHTKDHGMLCLQCFINAVGEDEEPSDDNTSTVDAEVITVPAHPEAVAEQAAQQAAEAKAEDKLNRFIEEMSDETPAAQAMAKADKDAWGDELMEEVTAGMMAGGELEKKKVVPFLLKSRLLH